MKYKLQHCSWADREHEKSFRQYAHTFHRKNVICVAESFSDLPSQNQFGILLHELGHLAYPNIEDEQKIDELIYVLSGIRIYREKTVETVQTGDLMNAVDYVQKFIEV
jgi:uncharacterized cupin superfamily protein